MLKIIQSSEDNNNNNRIENNAYYVYRAPKFISVIPV